MSSSKAVPFPSKPPVAPSIIIWSLVLLSALFVVWSTHQCRELMADLMSLKAEENRLQIEHGQFLLQAGALSAPSRLERLAEERLGMRTPSSSEIRVIRK